MRILITGASGFAGRHLVRLLAEEGAGKILALSGQTRVDSQDLPRGECVEWRRVDLRTPVEIEQAVAGFRPEGIIHLAAKTQVVEADEKPDETLALNTVGTMHLLNAMTRRSPDAKLVLVSSAAVYGAVEEDLLPAREDDTVVKPLGIYGVSKASAEMLAHVFAEKSGLKIVILRPFNHVGPGQSDAFAASSFARQVAEVEAGIREPRLLVGNLKAKRDLTDVRDIARAYRFALDLEPGTTYNVCSGFAVSMSEVVGLILRASGVDASVEVDPRRVRGTEIGAVLGDASRFRADGGWRPSYKLSQSIDDLIAYWRDRIGGSG